MADGDPMRYEFYDKMNTVSYLNLVAFKIAQQKDRKRIEERERIRLGLTK